MAAPLPTAASLRLCRRNRANELGGVLSSSRCRPFAGGSPCRLLALNGHFWTASHMSAFVGKADISGACSNVCL